MQSPCFSWSWRVPFVDWLTVAQQHRPEDARQFVGSLTHVFDPDDDDVIQRSTAGARKHQGSHETTLLVRSHGGRVTVSGNPSRWCRRDNLFGLDLDDAMAVINTELCRLGLPPFTQGHRGPDHARRELAARDGIAMRASDDAPCRWSGARFSRIDIAENFAAGSDDLAKLTISAYASRSMARLRKGHHGDETVAWIGARRTVKAYRKGIEMRLHAKSSPWIDWATTQGLVRHEVELKRRWLYDSGLCYWGNLTMGTLHRIFEDQTAHLRAAEAHIDPAGVESVPPGARLAYAAWLAGKDVRPMLSRTTFFRRRRLILNATGCDIGEPRPTATIHPIVRVVHLERARPPAGYSFEQEAA